jgi:hypothetical protein
MNGAAPPCAAWRACDPWDVRWLSLRFVDRRGRPGQAWSQTVVFAILILLMLVRPTGLLGQSVEENV